MPANIFIKIIQYIAYEKLDFAMKEVIYELLSIDVNSSYVNSDIQNTTNNNNSNATSGGNNNNNNNNTPTESDPVTNLNSLYNNLNSVYSTTATTCDSSQNSNLNTQNSFLNNNLSSSAYKQSKENLSINPLRMEIGLRAFIHIADTLQSQKENGLLPPQMPTTFTTTQTSNECLSIYMLPSVTAAISSVSNASSDLNASVADLKQQHQQQQQRTSTLTDALAREIGLGSYFEHVRRTFQDMLKTLDCTIGRTFLLTRPENTQSNQVDGSDMDSAMGTSLNSASASGGGGSSASSTNSTQTIMPSTAPLTGNGNVVPATSTHSAAAAVASAGSANSEVFSSSSSLHYFNQHHSNSVGSGSTPGAINVGKSLSVDLNDHTFKDTSLPMNNSIR